MRIVLTIIFVALVGCDAPSRDKNVARPSVQDGEATAALSKRQAYELAERCGKTASEEFRREWKEGSVKTESGNMIASFTSHYNSKLNKCFYLQNVMHYDKKKGAAELPQSFMQIQLYDIHENKEYGHYFATVGLDRLPLNGAPPDCMVQDKLCASEKEWTALVKPYMED